MLHIVFCIDELRAELAALAQLHGGECAQNASAILDELTAELQLHDDDFAAVRARSSIEALSPIQLEAAAPGTNAIPAADDLCLIRGIDKAVAEALAARSVTRFATVAAWTAEDVAALAGAGVPKARITEQNWIEQAAVLATGGTTHFSRRVLRGEPDCIASPPIEADRTAAAVAASGSNVVVLAIAARPAPLMPVAALLPADVSVVIDLEPRRRRKQGLAGVLRKAVGAAAAGLAALAIVGGDWQGFAPADWSTGPEATQFYPVRTASPVRSPLEMLALDFMGH